MAQANRLFLFARAALDAVVGGWPQDPADAVPLPDRRYVCVGAPAWDCAQFTVSVSRTYAIEADPAAEQLVSGPLFNFRAIVLDFQIVRCVPVQNGTEPPTPDQLEQSASDILVDAETIKEVLQDAQQTGRLAVQNGMAFDNWSASDPQGGFGGGMQRVRLSLF